MKLIMFARFTIIVAVPVVTSMVMCQECGAGWMQIWKRCASDATSFNVTVNVAPPVFGSGNVYGNMDLQVSNHVDICSPPYKETGKCARTVLDILGGLVTSKLLFAAFVAPVFSVIQSEPLIMKRYVQLRRCLKPGYMYSKDLILEMTSVVQYVEYALLFGVAIPIIVPLAALAVVKNLLVIHHELHTQEYPISREVAFTSQYLWLCQALGMAWVMWLYMSNGLSGT